MKILSTQRPLIRMKSGCTLVLTALLFAFWVTQLYLLIPAFADQELPSAPVSSKFNKETSKEWLNTYEEIISHGKNSVGLKDVTLFKSDTDTLVRLFYYKNLPTACKLMASSGLALNWAQFNQLHPSIANPSNYLAWKNYFISQWEQEKNSSDTAKDTKACLEMKSMFDGFEKTLMTDLATPTPSIGVVTSPHCYDPIDLISKGMALKGKLVCGLFRVIQKVDENRYLVGIPYTGEPSIDDSSFIVFGDPKTDSNFDYYDNETVHLMVTVEGTYSYENVTGANSTVIKLKDWKVFKK